MADQPKVLVVDDEEPIRDSCRQVLTKAGYECHTAVDGIEGLQLVDIRKPAEVAIGTIAGAVATPVRQLPKRTGELDIGRHVVPGMVEAGEACVYDFAADLLARYTYQGDNASQ